MKLDSKRKRRHALKGFSVFFAFFLWLYVLSSAQTKGEKIVKLNYKAPEGYAVRNQPVSEISYAIKGPRVFVRSLMQKNDRLVVDLSDKFKKNKTRYEVNVSELGVTFPFGVELTRVEPSRIVVQLEKALVKEVSVKPVTMGNIPSDHKLVKSSIDPQKVKIKGPATLIRKMKEIETAPIDISGLLGSDSVEAPLAILDERITPARSSVLYKYVVQPTRANMILKNIPVKFLSSRLVKDANRRSVNLMVLADNEEKLEYGQKDIKVIAEVPDSAKGKVEVKLKASLPPGLHLLEIRPEVLSVTVE